VFSEELHGIRLFYSDDGSGDPPLLLVHGLSCTSDDWSWQIPSLVAGHRVIAADNRGHGRSSTTGGGYTPRGFAADLAALLEWLKVGPVVVVGHSLGGVISSALAVEHPRLVKAVVVVDPAYGVGDDVDQVISMVLAGLHGPAAYETATGFIAAAEGATTPLHLRELHRRSVLRTPLPVFRETLSGLYRAEDQVGLLSASDDYLRRRTCPVLALHTDPGMAAWEATTFRHPFSRAVAWEDSGHWLHQEQTDRFNHLVLEWIARLPA
jgi:pimeloyl-ACP methyl ester carboxylesterase